MGMPPCSCLKHEANPFLPIAQLTPGQVPVNETPAVGQDAKVSGRAAEGALVDLADVVESLLRSLGDTLAGAVRLLIGGKEK